MEWIRSGSSQLVERKSLYHELYTVSTGSHYVTLDIMMSRGIIGMIILAGEAIMLTMGIIALIDHIGEREVRKGKREE